MSEVSPSPLARLDDLRSRQQAAWMRGERLPVEELVAGLTSTLTDNELLELIYAEVMLRAERDEICRVDDYVQRFPRFADSLRRLFSIHEALDERESEGLGEPLIARDFGGPSGSAGASPSQGRLAGGLSQGADRNLLFGILALQMDFIDRDGLVDALRDWTTQKDKPLGQILVERGGLSASRRELLEPLVDEHVRRHDHDPAASLASISSISEGTIDWHRVHDVDIAESLAVRRLTRNVKKAEAKSSPTGEGTTGSSTRFRVLRPHAKGGIGEVFLAFDEELNREVALKEIQTRHLPDDSYRERFVREAEVTGGLEHPGIVPVYSLGHHGDGRPFYAMRFIRGDSLKEAIERFHTAPTTPAPVAVQNDVNAPTLIQPVGWTPSSDENVAQAAPDGQPSPTTKTQVLRTQFESVEFRKLLGRFIAVCQAIEYAHSRGVLHRDLKPGNIMLGKYGETLVVDWGLAKIAGKADRFAGVDEATLTPASGSSIENTVDGSVIGTPAYMSPEQAAGKLDQLGPATDVYSLGATLYHILTRHSPFEKLPLAELLARVQSGDYPPPRAINSHVPKPLESICLKAMSVRPTDRYASTAELAADVECYLADEPVSANAEPLTIRARRWVKRHQTLVGSTAAAVMVATVTLSVLVFIVTGKNAALATANTKIQGQSSQITAQNETLRQTNVQLTAAKTDAETKRAAAEASAQVAREQSQLALSTLNSVIFDLQRAFQNVPGGAAVRQRLLTTALEKLEKVSTEFAAKSAVDRNTKVALDEMADTILQLGQGSPVTPRQESRASNDAVPASNDPTTKSAVLTAERLYRRAFEIAQLLAAANSKDPVAQRDLSISFHNLGDVFLKLGRTTDALTQFQDGLKIRRVLAEADPHDAQKQRDLSVSLERLGDAYLALGRNDDARAQFERRVRIIRELAAADPNDPQKQAELSSALTTLADRFREIDSTDTTLARLQESLTICLKLFDAEPQSRVNQRNLSVRYSRIGDLYLKTNQAENALKMFENSFNLDRTTAAANPDHVEHQRGLSVSHSRLGTVYSMLNRPHDALPQFENARKITRKIADADPNDFGTQWVLCWSSEQLAESLLKLGRINDCLHAYEESLTIRRTMIAADQSAWSRQRDLADTLSNLGGVFQKLNRIDDALRQHEEAQNLYRAVAESDPSNVTKQRDFSNSFDALGDVLLKLGRTHDALRMFEEFHKRNRAALELDRHDVQKQRDLSNSCRKLGEVFISLNRTDDARYQFEEGLKIVRTLAQADPLDGPKQREVMVFHQKLGVEAIKTRMYNDAHLHFKEGVAVLDRMIENGHSIETSNQEKAFLQQRIRYCVLARQAFGDWDTFLKSDTKLISQLLPFRGTEMLKRGELAHAVQSADKLRELTPKEKNNLYNTACLYSECADFVIKGKPAPNKAEQAEQQKFRNLAIECLKESLAAGWDDFAHMRKDEDLKSLHGLPEFEALFPKK